MISRRAFLGRGSAIAVSACGAALAGCSVGKPYVAPQPDLPPRFPGQDAVASSGAVALAAWWRGLGDPSLTACVEAALTNNADLRVAAGRIEQARAGLDAVRALSLPIGQVSGVAGRGEDSASSPEGRLLDGFRLSRETDLYTSVLAVGWEADLFGQIRQAREARAAQVELEEEKARAMRVAVAAETVRAYVLLRALQGRSAILDARTVLAERALTLAERRAAVGEGARVEVNASRAELIALRSARPPLEAGLIKAADALDLLQGASLGQSRVLLAEPGELPAALPAAVLDAPAAAVARRPDVAAGGRAGGDGRILSVREPRRTCRLLQHGRRPAVRSGRQALARRSVGALAAARLGATGRRPARGQGPRGRGAGRLSRHDRKSGGRDRRRPGRGASRGRADPPGRDPDRRDRQGAPRR